MEVENVYPTQDSLVENRDPIRCPECNREFSNRGALRMHTVKTHHHLKLPSDFAIQSRTNRVTTKKQRFFCPHPDCKKNYESNRSLVQHYQKVHCPKRYQCTACENKFSLERDLRYHAKKFCYKSSDGSTKPTRSQQAKLQKHVKRTTQATQTDNIVVRLMIGRNIKLVDQNIQTDEPMPNYSLDSNYSNYAVPETSDFGGQYGQSSFAVQTNMQYVTSVPTYDQATMYDNFATTSSYMSQAPEMVDVSTYATDSHNYYMDPNNFLTQTTQTHCNQECLTWRETLIEPEYRQIPQTNSSTQTSQPLGNWY